MKGIAHFAVGVAVASCVPEVVRAAAQGDPTYFILGGVFGLLPDTVDFKVLRYFYRHDIEVTPDPCAPNAQCIADAVAEAINRAHRSGKCVRVKLNTIPMGVDQWQRYTIRFDVAARKVVVRYGPVVDSGGNVIPNLVPPRAEAVAPVQGEMRIDYLASTQVDIFDGPVFCMEPIGDGRVSLGFIPWHRAWSHSLPLAVVLGVMGWALRDVWAGMIIAGAAAMHALCDQLGYMGGALFYPFNPRRVSGLRIMHSGESGVNFAAVWGSCLLIFWNLWRAAPGGIPAGGTRTMILFGVVYPMLIAAIGRFGLRVWPRRAAIRPR